MPDVLPVMRTTLSLRPNIISSFSLCHRDLREAISWFEETVSFQDCRFAACAIATNARSDINPSFAKTLELRWKQPHLLQLPKRPAWCFHDVHHPRRRCRAHWSQMAGRGDCAYPPHGVN